jgi:hypothetical protein
VSLVLANLGAARLDVIGPVDLTMNAAGAIEIAKAFPKGVLVPAHYEGWAHFSESAAEVVRAFEVAGLTNRLHWLKPGIATFVG